MSNCCKSIEWNGCEKHLEILFTGKACPVCEREVLITAAEEEKIQMENQIASLEMLRATATED